MDVEDMDVEDTVTTRTNVSIDSNRRAELVREKAYELWVERGCLPGQDLENWLDAEKAVALELQKSAPNAGRPAVSAGATKPRPSDKAAKLKATAKQDSPPAQKASAAKPKGLAKLKALGRRKKTSTS